MPSWHPKHWFRNQKSRACPRGRYCLLQVEQLEDRTVPTIVGTPDQNFVDQVYHDVLKRAASTPELTFWTGFLNQGVSRLQIVLSIEVSVEHRLVQAQTVFKKIMERDIDGGNLIVDSAFLAAGGTERQLEGLLAATPEFTARTGGTNSGFLKEAFHDILGRQASDLDVASWLPVMAGSVSRLQVATLIASGQEEATYRVADPTVGLYNVLLGRPADEAGQNALVTFLQGSGNLDLLVAGVAGSLEYYQHAQVPPVTAVPVPTLPTSASKAAPLVAITNAVSNLGNATPGQVTLTVTVTAPPGATTQPAGGQVLILQGGTVLGKAALMNGQALVTIALTSATNTVVAQYDGTSDPNFNPATSPPRNLVFVDLDDGGNPEAPDDINFTDSQDAFQLQ